MITRVTPWICLGALAGAIGYFAGCTPQPPSTTSDVGLMGNGDNSGQDDPGQGPGSGIGDPSCTRTVDTIPSNVFLSTSVSGVSSIVSGASTGLGRALRPMYNMSVQISGPLMLYEIGADGQVLAGISLLDLNGTKTYMRMSLGGRFTVDKSCISYESETDHGVPAWVENGEGYQDPICGSGRIPLWQTGMIGTGGGGEHICLDVEGLQYCARCWQDTNGWHQEMNYTVRYTALGTLDVAVEGQWDQDIEWVTVASGESIVAESAFEFHYLISPSPEELGYQPFALPGWP